MSVLHLVKHINVMCYVCDAFGETHNCSMSVLNLVKYINVVCAAFGETHNCRMSVLHVMNAQL